MTSACMRKLDRRQVEGRSTRTQYVQRTSARLVLLRSRNTPYQRRPLKQKRFSVHNQPLGVSRRTCVSVDAGLPVAMLCR
jgi:hypothetical protein